MYLFKIPLGNRKGDIVDYALIDQEDYDRIKDKKWHRQTAHIYQNCKSLYYAVNGNTRMHVLLMGPAPNGKIIDHKNNNGLNNSRKTNLRFVTPGENSQNVAKRSDTTSVYKGVSWSKHHKK